VSSHLIWTDLARLRRNSKKGLYLAEHECSQTLSGSSHSPAAAGLNMREIDDSLPWVLKSGATIHGIGGRHATRKVHRQVRPQPFRLVGDHGTRTNLTAQDAFEELGADAPPA
jgi:hypothetical protein